MKKLLIGMTAVCLTVALTGCFGKGANENSTNADNGIVSNVVDKLSSSRTEKLFKGNYYMKCTEKNESGVEATVEITKNGEKLAVKTPIEDSVIRFVVDGKISYTIMDSEKALLRMSTSDEDISELDFSKKLENAEITKSEETIDGVKYDVEEIEDGKFYYLGNDLKMITSEGTELKILEISSKSNDDLLAIPTDYTDLTSYIGE